MNRMSPFGMFILNMKWHEWFSSPYGAAPKLDVHVKKLKVHAHSALPLHMEWHQRNYYSTEIIGATSKLDVHAHVTPMFCGNVNGTYIYYWHWSGSTDHQTDLTHETEGHFSGGHRFCSPGRWTVVYCKAIHGEGLAEQSEDHSRAVAILPGLRRVGISWWSSIPK